MGGMHNVEKYSPPHIRPPWLIAGIEDEKIREAVAAFKGVRRRFEYIVKKPGLVFIDDYAIPEELRVLNQRGEGLFGGMKCHRIFQPHLFSRTRDFADGFCGKPEPGG